MSESPKVTERLHADCPSLPLVAGWVWWGVCCLS